MTAAYGRAVCDTLAVMQVFQRGPPRVKQASIPFRLATPFRMAKYLVLLPVLLAGCGESKEEIRQPVDERKTVTQQKESVETETPNRSMNDMAATVAVAGRVFDSSINEPIAGATVTVAGRGPVQSDQNGLFCVEVPKSGPVTWDVSAPGYTSLPFQWDPAGGKAVTRVELHGAALVSGKVSDVHSGRPIDGAKVEIAHGRRKVETDEQGRFRIEDVRSGSAELEINAPGYSAQKITRNLIAGEDTAIEVKLTGDATLAGRVVNGVDDEPIANAEVQVVGVSRSARTDRDGQFRFTELPSGRVEIEVHASGYQPCRLAQSVSTAEDAVYRIELERDADLDTAAMKVTPVEDPEVRAAAAMKVTPVEDLEVRAAPKGIYAWRTSPRTEKWLQIRGASRESEQAVADGLSWLARHQSDKGVWSAKCVALKGANPHAQCEATDPCGGPGSSCDMAHTGLALLAFQAGGHYYFNNRAYSENVERGLKWMVEHQKRDGALFGSGNPVDFNMPMNLNMSVNFNMYEHGIATFALAEACAVAVASNREPDSRYLDAAKAAVQFIEQRQHNDGGWRYTPNKSNPSDTSVSGWQVLALKTAIEAGIEVDEDCLAKVEAFFKSCEMGQDGRTAYMADKASGSEAMTGVGMLVHQFLLHRPRSPLVQAGARHMARFAQETWGETTPEELLRAPKLPDLSGFFRRVDSPDGAKPADMQQVLQQLGINRDDLMNPEKAMDFTRGLVSKRADYYLWYNCTLAASRAGGEPWNQWNAIVRDLVVGLQEKKGCARGSWDPTITLHGMVGGRVYTTALAVLTLEVYYRFAPE